MSLPGDFRQTPKFRTSRRRLLAAEDGVQPGHRLGKVVVVDPPVLGMAAAAPADLRWSVLGKTSTPRSKIHLAESPVTNSSGQLSRSLREDSEQHYGVAPWHGRDGLSSPAAGVQRAHWAPSPRCVTTGRSPLMH